MPERNGNGTQQLVYWILGALLTAVLLTSGWAHSVMMGQLDDLRARIGRMEEREMSRGRPPAPAMPYAKP